MSERPVRIVSTSGSDEFNVEVEGKARSYKFRPDGAWIVPASVAAIICGDGRSGFVERADDEATLREITLLASVLTDEAMRVRILDVTRKA